MHIEYELRERDLEAFAGYQVRRSPNVRRQIRRMRLAYAIGFLLLIAGFLLTDGLHILILALGTIGLLLFILAPQIYEIRLRRHFLNEFRNPANSLKYRFRRLELTPEGVEDTSDLVQASFKWSAVSRIDRAPSYGFIYITSNTAYVIPRDAVGPEAFDSFMDLATTYRNQAAA
jgi:hypothetical protein